MFSVGHCDVVRLQMKVGHMDGMYCLINSTFILVKIKPVSLYNCRTVYFKKRNHLEDLGIDWKIILKLILNRMGGCGLYSFGLDRDKWQGVVNTVVNLQGP